MRFADIPGLTDVKKLLTEAVRNSHAAHAQLFSGAEGALNLPLALAYATYLHCENPTETDACGSCAACSKSGKFVHPDTHFVFPLSNIKGDKDEDRFKAEMLKTWRSFLSENPFGTLQAWTNFYGGEDKMALIAREESREIVKTLALKPFESKNKVMIIWQPELMHSSAANGILKILEEPPPQTFFLLVTNAGERLLPTIISRTQIVTVPLLDHESLTQLLIGKHGVDEKKAAQVSRLADGHVELAIKLLDQPEDDNAQRFTEWMRACFKNNFATLVTMADDYHNLDKLSQRNLFVYGIHMMRESLLHLSGAGELIRSQGEEQKFVQDFSKVLSMTKIESTVRGLNEACGNLERNGSAKMIFLDLSIHISKTLRAES